MLGVETTASEKSPKSKAHVEGTESLSLRFIYVRVMARVAARFKWRGPGDGWRLCVFHVF